ncbi:uncharacterized protein LOC131259104 [Anopheles coustani]|uniref:uncharacterized protein LOC131259104 n=1 Tax=Anopheles coustani TaxID=139045 RepID=UPI0026593E0C|nr:uncharacterized protein LOC131259104 [Anopheles coustani]
MCENHLSQLPKWAQKEMASLKRQIEAWKELSQSAMFMVKEKDKEIARLQANGGAKETCSSAPIVKPGQPGPPAKGTSAIVKPMENTSKQAKIIEKLLQNLQNPLEEGTVGEILYDYAMRVNEILTYARDDKGNIDPSYEKKLLPKFVANLPYFAEGEWNDHVRKLPKGPLLDEFGGWILDAAENAHRWFYYITPCMVCGINSLCQSLEECETFEEMDVNDRWKVVRKNNLCQWCLASHHGRCYGVPRCGENGCAGKHHWMLHNNRR